CARGWAWRWWPRASRRKDRRTASSSSAAAAARATCSASPATPRRRWPICARAISPPPCGAAPEGSAGLGHADRRVAPSDEAQLVRRRLRQVDHPAFDERPAIVDPHRHHLAVALVGDRKSTRLNSSHVKISYAVFC